MNNLIVIDITDEIGPLLERMAAHTKPFIGRAAKSLGYMMQKEIKEGIKSGAPGGDRFESRIAHKVRAAVQGGKAARTWYGRMRQAIGYQYEDGTLKIGWTSRTAAAYGEKQEFGYRTEVTKAIRKRWGEAGYPLTKDKKTMDLPERPIFEPMAGELGPKIGPFFEEKIRSYVEESVTFSKKARRKYKVY